MPPEKQNGCNALYGEPRKKILNGYDNGYRVHYKNTLAENGNSAV